MQALKTPEKVVSRAHVSKEVMVSVFRHIYKLSSSYLTTERANKPGVPCLYSFTPNPFLMFILSHLDIALPSSETPKSKVLICKPLTSVDA